MSIPQTTPPLVDVVAERENQPVATAHPQPASPERMANVWVGRVTTIVGAIFLLSALSIWFARPGHYRLVLMFLTVAMFAAILHSYTFESGQQ